MIIHFQICDHCHQIARGVTFTSYRIEGGPSLDICPSCERSPFRRVTPSPRGTAILEVARLALEAP
jgi:hypothetical protein